MHQIFVLCLHSASIHPWLLVVADTNSSMHLTHSSILPPDQLIIQETFCSWRFLLYYYLTYWFVWWVYIYIYYQARDFCAPKSSISAPHMFCWHSTTVISRLSTRLFKYASWLSAQFYWQKPGFIFYCLNMSCKVILLELITLNYFKCIWILCESRRC